MKAGTLEIEMITNLARLQSDMDQVKRSVGKTMNDVSRASETAGKAVSTMGNLLAGVSLGVIAGEIARANREFQSLFATLKVATGSAEAAASAMEQIKQFAMETPYGLQQSVEAFVKLKNLGLTPSMEAMRAYGNTAASMGKDLMQMVEAVADAATGEFERLKEFGIKASKEGENVTFTFQGVATTVRNSASEIEKYLQGIGNNQFAGAMAGQMETLNGQAAGLSDSLDGLYIRIGELGANSVLTQMMAAAGAAIEFTSQHLDTIVNVLGAAVIGYGAYAAATAVAALSQTALSGSLGLYILAVRTAYAEVGILGAAHVALGGATAGAAAGIRTLTVAMLANPAVWFAAAVTAVVMAFKGMSDASRDAEDRLRANAKAAAELGMTLDQTSQLALQAANENRGLGASASASEPAIWGFKHASDNLTESLWKQAKAARAARVEMLQQKVTEAKQRESDAMGLTYGGARNTLDEAGAALRQGDFLRAGSKLWDAQSARWKQVLSGGRVAQEAARDYVGASRLAIEAQRQLDKALSEPIGRSDILAPAVQSVQSGGAKLKGAGAAAGAEAGKATATELIAAFAKTLEPGIAEAFRKIGNEAETEIQRIKDQFDVDWPAMFEGINKPLDEAWNSTTRFNDSLAELKQIAGDLDFGEMFGRGGEAVNRMGDAMARLTAAQEKHGEAIYLAGNDQERIAKADAAFTQARLNGTVAMIGAAKGLFKEHSAGYKVMAAAEKAFAVVQLANTAVNIAAGAAKMFATLGPFAFPAVAAMIAVMAGLGAAVSGGGGGYRPPSAEEVQAGQGSGSVLGDGEAKSGSIGNALELMLKNTSRDLEYSNEMVKSLRAIETNIGALTGLLARQLNVTGGGAFDTSGLGLGSSTKLPFMLPLAMNILDDIPVIGGLLGGIAKALFGTKKTVTLLDQGISFASQTVEDIINGGAVGQIYQDVQTQTKKKFLGLTTSNKTKVTTQYGDLDNDMERQIALIIGSLRAGIVDAAGILGVTGAEAALDAFKVNLGKISLKDLTGEEIREQLEAVFSKLGDDMAETVLPGLTAFQRVGEGMFETLARLAKDYATIDTALSSIGMTFGQVGLSSVAARESLIGLFGGLDAFVEQTSFFRENFLTEAEQMAPIISAVNAEMARLGHAGVTTKDQFKALVLGLDLSSESGGEMYASLMAVAPAFAKVIEYLDALEGELGETGKTAAELAAIAKSKRALEIEIMELEGDAIGALNARRADEKAANDQSLHALIDRRNALKDEAEAAAKALAEQEKFQGLRIRLAEAQGDTDLAKQLRRQAELNEATDEQTRAILRQIHAAEDAADKLDAVADALEGIPSNFARGGKPTEAGGSYARGVEAAAAAEEARLAQQEEWSSRLAEAYERQSGELKELIDRFRQFADELRALRKELLGEIASPDASFRQLQVEWMKTSALASTGDEKALGTLGALSREYADAALARSTSQQEYDRHILTIARGLEEGAQAADSVVDYNTASLQALSRQVEGQIETNQKLDTVIGLLREGNGERSDMRAEQRDIGMGTLRETSKYRRAFDRVTGGGNAMVTETSDLEQVD